MTVSTLRVLKRAVVAGLLAPAVTAALAGVTLQPAAASPETQGGRGGGGGVGISIDIGGVLDAVRRAQERQQTKPQETKACPDNMVRTRSGRCVCEKGYTYSRGACRKRPPVDVVITPAPSKPKPEQVAKPKPPPELAIDAAEVQECLQRAGYDPGPIDGRPGPQTRSALRDFQNDHGLSARPASLNDEQTLDRLFDVCRQPQTVATRSAAPATAAPGRCLPRDLHELLARTYGRRPAVPVCAEACLPKPVFYSQARLDEVAQSRGVTWCENCIALGTWLPLPAVLQIERVANVTLCAAPALCYTPARPVIETRSEIRTVFRTLPRTIRNDGDVAVIVGNEEYRSADIAPNPTGNNDAAAVRTLLTEQLGYAEANIIDLRQATLADLERVFGRDGEVAGTELAQRLGQRPQASVFVYVSSHGLTEEDTKQAFVLPIDAEADRPAETAYPLQRLYDNLGKLGARTVMVMLEAEFATEVGTPVIDPPNLPELSVDAMPATPVPGLAVFKASDRDQRTIKDPEFGIGLFTRHMIEGLAGKADQEPIGNADARLDIVELYVYIADLVRLEARKSHGVEQKPILSRVDNLLVGKLAQR